MRRPGEAVSMPRAGEQSAAEVEILRVNRADLDLVLPVIREFYAHFGFSWDEPRKRAVLGGLVARPDIGRLWQARVERKVVGYALIALYTSLEFDGVVAILDELWVTEGGRNGGIGGRLLEAVGAELRTEGIQVLRLELDELHPRASGLYRRRGFRPDGRQVWTWRMDGRIESGTGSG